jgi:hypothetical protein
VITVYFGVAALLVWVGFELVFRSRGEASSWRGDVRIAPARPSCCSHSPLRRSCPARCAGWRLDQ